MRAPRAVAALGAIVCIALSAAPAGAATPRVCSSADMRYPFVPGGRKTLGLFKLTITRGTCRTARRVAKLWMQRFEARIAESDGTPPRSVAGFTFTQLPAQAAQEVRVRGRRDATSIRFDYRVPDG